MSSKINRIQSGQDLGGHMKSPTLLFLLAWLLVVLAVPLTAAAQDTKHTLPATRYTVTDLPKRKAAAEACLKDRRIYDLRSTFASRANGCHASGLTVAQLLGHANAQVLPTYVKPLDENTRAVIAALDIARNAHTTKVASIQ
jgi:integrase